MSIRVLILLVADINRDNDVNMDVELHGVAALMRCDCLAFARFSSLNSSFSGPPQEEGDGRYKATVIYPEGASSASSPSSSSSYLVCAHQMGAVQALA
jgi:hypothetical protein